MRGVIQEVFAPETNCTIKSLYFFLGGKVFSEIKLFFSKETKSNVSLDYFLKQDWSVWIEMLFRGGIFFGMNSSSYFIWIRRDFGGKLTGAQYVFNESLTYFGQNALYLSI